MRCMTWVVSIVGICEARQLREIMTDPLQCTFEDARRQHRRDGIAMSTAAKIAWFEEMVTLAVRFGAVDRLRDQPERSVVDKTDSAP